MKEIIPVYIGYDEVESGAFWTCADSILQHATQPVAITPIKRTTLPLGRPKHPKQSNQFAFSRWMVPHLQKYQGYGIFVDCDFLFLSDIAELWFLRDSTKAVQVCKHPSDTFKEGTKYLGTEQTVYEKKCWSSLMLFNCAHKDCHILHPDYIDIANGLDLHQFRWTTEDNIGDLPLSWNYLVGHSKRKDFDKVDAVHYTEGGPYFKEYEDCEYGTQWWDAFNKMKYVKEGLT